MNPIGIMQGRLSPPVAGKIQAFPAASWRAEFPLAATCGLNRIEWIVEVEGFEANPFMTDAGRAEIRRLADATGVRVRSVCADWFMDFPLVAVEGRLLQERLDMLERIVECASRLGVEHVDVPFVDASKIDGERQIEAVAAAIRGRVRVLERTGVRLCLETSLPSAAFHGLLERIGHSLVGANHDIGNSASLGYAAADEFEAIGRWIWCVHVKDRLRGGGSVPLGQGSADFRASFAEIAGAGFAGAFILQVARGAEGQEAEWARKNVEFVRGYLAQAPAGPVVKGGVVR